MENSNGQSEAKLYWIREPSLFLQNKTRVINYFNKWKNINIHNCKNISKKNFKIIFRIMGGITDQFLIFCQGCQIESNPAMQSSGRNRALPLLVLAIEIPNKNKRWLLTKLRNCNLKHQKSCRKYWFHSLKSDAKKIPNCHWSV